MGSKYLDMLFSPRAVAVFGASDDKESVGGRVFDNLVADGYAGDLYAVNPKHRTVNGKPCYPNLAAVDGNVDLAVIATPANTVPDILSACGKHGVHSAVLLSAGFSDGEGNLNATGARMLQQARNHDICVLGPNCLGIIRPQARLNATFSNSKAAPGNLALISQSGALCTAILDWAPRHNIGFSAVVSLGDAADIDFGSLLDFFSTDTGTDGILLYVEGIRDARAFMSGLRAAARIKPVVVLKVGRHERSARAALSHTGALVGADDVFDAALSRAGAVRADNFEQLFTAAELLARGYRVAGNRLAIVTNGGGPGIMAVDRAVDLDIALADLSAETARRLNELLPPHWSHGNPVDILGDAPPARYRQAIDVCLHDHNIDGLVVLLTPQAMTHPQQVAEQLVEVAKRAPKKPLLTCWMGDEQVEPARRIFLDGGVPTFSSPEETIDAFHYLVAHRRNQELLLQVPGPVKQSSEPDVEGASMIIESALAEHRNLLTRNEAGAVLAAFGIPVTPAVACATPGEALIAAETLGFPVAMKIDSPDIVHKSDVGGVRLGINTAGAVRSTFSELIDTVKASKPEAVIRGVTVEPMLHDRYVREIMAGATRDSVFGPVISFGAGGVMLELIRDRALALPPLNTLIIERLISGTRVSALLDRFRGMPAVDRTAIVDILRHLSEMTCELPAIREIDLNPLAVSESGAVVLDPRIVVDEQAAPGVGRYAHMAIHPYPMHLDVTYQLPDGINVLIRPIRPEDAAIEQAFVKRLSDRSKYFRFMHAIRELTPEMLVRFTQIDYDREMALIAVTRENGNDVEIGVARYITNADETSCEFAIVVAEDWANRGIGSRLMRRLMEIARQRGLRLMEGEVLSENRRMLAMSHALGFKVTTNADDRSILNVSRVL